MLENDDIEIKFNTKCMPFEYKLLEYRLMINKELYDEKVIDLRVFNEMQRNLIARLTKIKNEYLKVLNDVEEKIKV